MLLTEDILYEDKQIIVCRKLSGIATQTAKLGEPDMVSNIKNYLGTPYAAVIHRLDQPVEGILVFAKTKEAAAGLSRQSMDKRYYAVIWTESKHSKKDVLIDYLLKAGKENISKVVSQEIKDAKRAELEYRIIRFYEDMAAGDRMPAMAEVCLRTGRHHQIRIQMANAGMPLLGDWKYGTEDSIAVSRNINMKEIALCAYHLGFYHPLTNKKINVTIIPKGMAFKSFLPVNP